MDGAALPQTFSKPQFWYTNTCADALRWGIPTEAKQAADPRPLMGGIHSVTAALSPNCLLVSLEHGLANINEGTIANDPRSCARASRRKRRGLTSAASTTRSRRVHVAAAFVSTGVNRLS